MPAGGEGFRSSLLLRNIVGILVLDELKRMGVRAVVIIISGGVQPCTRSEKTKNRWSGLKKLRLGSRPGGDGPEEGVSVAAVTVVQFRNQTVGGVLEEKISQTKVGGQ